MDLHVFLPPPLSPLKEYRQWFCSVNVKIGELYQVEEAFLFYLFRNRLPGHKAQDSLLNLATSRS